MRISNQTARHDGAHRRERHDGDEDEDDPVKIQGNRLRTGNGGGFTAAIVVGNLGNAQATSSDGSWARKLRENFC